MTIRILTAQVKTETDVVSVRQRAKQIAQLCGFGMQDQVRIATSVSELARNVFNYAGQGKISFAIEGNTAPQILTIHIEDNGPGIENLDLILSGNYKSPTGMGMGIIGARRLADRFNIKTGPDIGTHITLKKIFPRFAALITPESSSKIFARLANMATEISVTEIMQQNQELLSALAELKARQDDLLLLTRELEDTNRGMVALYAELDEKAGHLRRADQMKSRFLSNMSHEFRTPLSSIRALAKLLLDHVDGDLSFEQEKQVAYILQAATGLNELVNDLLDIAKIEAGKVDVRPSLVDVGKMFSALRGMLRPLLISESLRLTFVEPETPLELFTDEAKLSQILRNFISNALKFTEAGDIVVKAISIPEKNQVMFSVADTGVGIREEDLQLIFEEFSQIEHPLQRKVKGTGLGLPLCRNLAKLLRGDVAVISEVNVGSTFSVTLPMTINIPGEIITEIIPVRVKTNDVRKPVLIIEDNVSVHLQYEKFLHNTEFRTIAARNLREAAERWTAERPVAVILDIVLQGEDSWLWLAEMKNDPARSDVPVIIVTEVEDKRKGLSLGADAYYVKPLFKQQLLSTLRTLVGQPSLELSHEQLSGI
ncbi:ATP-binding protein [Cellvibrio mixtus]|uniref:ATP-binding protein n=1 Tax=Cellvibrio mixtus TaxID=39650 RepID=UPI0005874E43|nr:ATP-binding protein [Cellvibrio mixtus]